MKMSILNEENSTIAPLVPFAAFGRLINLTKQKHYNGHVCHSAQPDGTFQPTTGDLRVSVRVVGAPKTLRIQPSSIVPLPPRKSDEHKNYALFAYETRTALRAGGGGADGERKLLHDVLNRLPYVGGISALIDEVVSYLRINRVDPASVRAVATSGVGDSTPNNAISYTLDERRDNWWISPTGSCPNGIGEEWVSYDLCPSPATTGGGVTAVRVDYLRLVIPPLPQGPLSVRTFHLEVSDTTGEKEGPWTVATEELVTLDSGEVQEWSIHPPIESRFVRIVCKENAALALGWVSTCIGFFTIGFS